MTSYPKSPAKRALFQPGDPSWGRCPNCQQSAQSKVNGRLVCHRCNWIEEKRALGSERPGADRAGH